MKLPLYFYAQLEKKSKVIFRHQKTGLFLLCPGALTSSAFGYTGTPRGRSVRPPQMSPCGRSISLRMSSESQLMAMSPRIRRTSSGHASDSELSQTLIRHAFCQQITQLQSTFMQYVDCSIKHQEKAQFKIGTVQLALMTTSICINSRLCLRATVKMLKDRILCQRKLKCTEGIYTRRNMEEEKGVLRP